LEQRALLSLTVTGVTPPAGSLGGSTAVLITGTEFTNATEVDFGATAVTNISINTAGTQITATSPAHSAGTIDITVLTPTGGTSPTSTADEFTYEAAPTVTGVSPLAGPLGGGTSVTITGTNFTAATAVDFGGTPATNVVVNTDGTQITATTPTHVAGTVDVTVVTPIGTSATSSADKFTYEAAPTVTGVSPLAGPLGGGTSVTITGTNFTAATEVDFGRTAATNLVVNAAGTQITATSPAHAAGAVDVTVVTPIGTSPTSSADLFTYEAAPTVTGITPLAGPLAGNTSVIITGTNFTGATAVDFGTTAVTNIVVNADGTQITATSPAHSAAAIDITVVTPSGTSPTSSADKFTYEAAPTVAGLSQTAGPLAGNTSVVITGTNFTAATAVDFGATPATNVVVNADGTQITATTPAHVAGTVDVTVVTPSGTSPTTPSADKFTYEAAPTVTVVSPKAGSLAGGTSVVITGTNFTAATAVNFGTTPATNVVVNAAGTQITATSPTHSAAAVDITVVTPSGTSLTSSADLFTYEAAPTVTGISPTAGPLAGGASVVITGTDFTAATAVNFGGTPATSVVVNGAGTQITVTSPAHSAAAVDITVVTPAGTSAIAGADLFTYEAAPTVTGLSQKAGPLTGGTSVVITGTNFTGATAVNFGTTAATSITVNTAGTQITATSPAHSAAAVDITVVTPSGISTIAAADQFTYEAAPTVTGISPTAGPLTGGTSVVITGTNFIGATAVEFGSTLATNVVVNATGTQITATSLAHSAGMVDITVVTPSGTSAVVTADQFTYVAAPTVTVVSPKAGPLAGGTPVTITGTNLAGATEVDFGTTVVTASAFTSDSATQIVLNSPAGSASTVDVKVVTAGGTSATSTADQFTYVAAPTVTGLSRTVEPLAGGTPLIITGTNLANATAVKFGTTVVSASAFTSDTGTQILLNAPAGSAGTVDVTVVTAGGTSAISAADHFTYVAAPSVTVVASTKATGTYGVGTVIPITVTFSEPVIVTWTPQLTLNAGSGAVANYTGGSGTATLTFIYTAAAGQNSSDLDATALTLNNGTIQDAAGNAAVLTVPSSGTEGDSLVGNKIVIDTMAPTVTGVSSTEATGTYGAGIVIPITVTFSEAVTVTGTPQLTLNAGSAAVANYISGNGTATFTFSYTVAAGQNSSDLDYTATTALVLNGGGIQDAVGNAAVLTLPTTGSESDDLAAKNLVIHTTTPSVTNVLWQNQSTGMVGMWLVQNAQNAGWTQIGQADPSVWKAVGVGDFTGNGNADVLWQNQTTGLVGMWRIQNATNTGWVSFGQADPNVWTVVGVADFNGDGYADVLWQNQSTGLVGMWRIQNGVSTGWVSLGQTDPSVWKLVGVGDFNKDGYADVLWQNRSTGLVGAWLSSAPTLASPADWAPLGQADPSLWTVAGVGDFNGDGIADVLWQNQSNGLVGIWPITLTNNIPTNAGWTRLGQADPSEWTVADVGDFNGDGIADVLWQNQSSGLVGIWPITLTNNTPTNAGWTRLGQADPTQWNIVGVPWGQPGSPLLAASVGTAPATGSATLTGSQLQPIVNAAIARWTSAGLDAATLQKLTQVQFVISDLPGSYLGEAEGNRITIDPSAAGNGWFVDTTPTRDEEFALSGGQRVAVDPRAVDRIDLLTVVEHELGHVAGLSDIYASTDDLMNGVLGKGVRRDPAHADAVLASL
jgi:hypothetical protein